MELRKIKQRLLKLRTDNRGFVISGAIILGIIAVAGAIIAISVTSNWTTFQELITIAGNILLVYLPTIIGVILTLMSFIVLNFPIVLMLAEMCIIGLAMMNASGDMALMIIYFARYNLSMFNFLWKLTMGFIHILIDLVKMVKPAG